MFFGQWPGSDGLRPLPRLLANHDALEHAEFIRPEVLQKSVGDTRWRSCHRDIGLSRELLSNPRVDVSRLLRQKARVVADRLELKADETVERYRRIAASRVA